MKYWKIPGWVTVDIYCPNFYDKVLENEESAERISKCLIAIQNLISELKREDIIHRWFFLYEGSSIRVRLETPNKVDFLRERIRKPLYDFAFSVSDYKEEKPKFKDIKAIDYFIRIMEVTSEMALDRFNGNTNYDSYRMYERICHCLHNLMYGRGNETLILSKRISERLSAYGNESMYNFLKTEK